MPALSVPTLRRPRSLPAWRKPRPPHASRARRILLLVAAVAVIAVLLLIFWPSSAKATATAHFPRAVGLFEGSDVRVLGVRVGKVLEVKPEGRSVRVRFEYDKKHKMPADAKVALISPSVVSDRYLQLFPVYRGGPILADGADIPLERTAVPVELDRMMESLDTTAVGLGPKGANKDGALSRLFAVGAQNLQGQGEKTHQTLTDLAAAVNALSSSRGDLFTTLRNLQTFTTALATNDAQVRAFNTDLASVADQLDGEREELGAALKNLGIAMEQVRGFVRDNRTLVKTNVDALTTITQVLVRQKQSLAEFLDVAPTALSNLQLSYNPSSGTLDTRMDLRQLTDPGGFLCQLVATVAGDRECTDLIAALKKLPQLPAGNLGKVLGGNGTVLGSVVPGLTGSGRDLTLGGILEAQ